MAGPRVYFIQTVALAPTGHGEQAVQTPVWSGGVVRLSSYPLAPQESPASPGNIPRKVSEAVAAFLGIGMGVLTKDWI